MWHVSQEQICARLCDESQVRIALHKKAFYWYKRALTCFQLPIIVLSACSGSMQFLSKSYPNLESVIITCTAGTSVLVSIISAVMTYLKLGELQAKNEHSAIAWQGFFNLIKHEMSLARALRRDPQEFIEEIKQQHARLFEISPLCNRDFVKAIKKSVQSKADELFEKPCYLNGYDHCQVYREEDDEFEENSV